MRYVQLHTSIFYTETSRTHEKSAKKPKKSPCNHRIGGQGLVFQKYVKTTMFGISLVRQPQQGWMGLEFEPLARLLVLRVPQHVGLLAGAFCPRCLHL
jgi:hypothetical protein